MNAFFPAKFCFTWATFILFWTGNLHHPTDGKSDRDAAYRFHGSNRQIALWFVQSKQNFVWENGQVLAALAGLNFQVQI